MRAPYSRRIGETPLLRGRALERDQRRKDDADPPIDRLSVATTWTRASPESPIRTSRLSPLPLAPPLQLRAFGPSLVRFHQQMSRSGPQEDPSRLQPTERLPHAFTANPASTVRRTPPHRHRGVSTDGRQRGSSSEKLAPNAEPAADVATAPPILAPAVKRTPPSKRRSAPTAGPASGSSSEELSPSPRHPRTRENPHRTNAELRGSCLRCCHRGNSRYLPREAIVEETPGS